MRKTIGAAILAASVIFSALDLLDWVRPLLLRMRAHGGIERVAGIILSSLSLKAIVLIVGVLLAFWPSPTSGSSSKS
jgi:hypothetical protein